MKNVSSEFKLSVEKQQFEPAGIKAWLIVFPVVSALAIMTQMSPAFAVWLATTFAATEAVIAHLSVQDVDNNGKFEAKQRIIGFIAPAQFALLMWISVLAGSLLTSTFVTASAVSFVVFAGLLVLDFAAAAAILCVLERREGVCGLSLASLINGKYSRLFGRLI